MQHVEPTDVTIRTRHFEMEGVIQGGLDSFVFESTNSHFSYWFPDYKIDSLQIDRKTLKPEQLEIVEACEAKIRELIH